jgi:hypothetical protein
MPRFDMCGTVMLRLLSPFQSGILRGQFAYLSKSLLKNVSNDMTYEWIIVPAKECFE